MRHFVLLTAIVSATLFGAPKKQSGFVPTHVQNPAFSETESPQEDEPEIKDDKAKTQWKTASEESSGNCSTHQVWVSDNPEAFHVVAFKNDHIPKRAIFTRSRFIILEDRKTGKASGTGKIDLSSYYTGDNLLDWRIQRYILRVENPKYPSVATFAFDFDDWSPKKKTWETNLSIKLKMLQKEFSFPAFVSLGINGDQVRLSSKSDARFTYAYPGVIKQIVAMMKRCNHHSLATFVDVGLDVELKNVCK